MVARNQSAEDSSPLIQWLPRTAWINGNSADDQLPNYSQGSFMLTTTLNAKAQFSFNGTGVWIYGAKRSNHGPYQCAIDGSPSPQQNGFSAQNQFQTVLCGFSGLAMGPHVVTISDQLTNAAAAPYLDVDFIVWETEISDAATQPTTVVDDADPSLNFKPPKQWNTNQCNNMGSYWATTCHITSSTTAYMTYNFNGDAIAIFGGVGPTYGAYTVKLDDQALDHHNASGTNAHAQELLYFASGLGPGNHTVTLSNNPASIGDAIDIDYIQVLASYPQNTTLGDGNSGSTTKHRGAAAIVAPIVVVLLLLLVAVLGFLYWRRRRQERRNRVDLNAGAPSPKDEFSAMNMGMIPTPYTIGGPNSQSSSQTPLVPQGPSINHPISNWVGATSQYSHSEPASPPHTDNTFNPQQMPFAGVQQAPSVVGGQTAYTLPDAMSASGSGSGSASGSVIGGPARMPPISAVGGKAANLYQGPTVRNEDVAPTAMEAPPPAYA